LNRYPNSVIDAKGLILEYAPGRGVCGVTFSVEKGECFALLGRNGSGKSSLVRLILGLERPSGGELNVFGYYPPYRSIHCLSRIGAALDTSIHWEGLSGRENMYFVARSYHMPVPSIDGRINRLFNISDLSKQAEDPVTTYSFGMRRKLSLIQAVCHDPELLVLDEPTNGIDAQFLLRFAELIRARTQNGKTTFLSSNDPDWVQNVADRVGFIESGKILKIGKVEKFVEEISVFQEIKIIIEGQGSIPLIYKGGVHSFKQTGKTITAILEPEPMLVPTVMEWIVSHGGVIKSVEVHRSTLRDAFLLKTGRTLDK
jgi:ABC-type multidrug transport system ATPase subunit